MQTTPNKAARWPLIRQGIVFQLKLGLDALRDILMSPVSIVLVIIDVVMANNQQQSYFMKLMGLGKKSDHWINLFAVEPLDKDAKDNPQADDNNVDYWFSKIETVVKEQRVDGKLTKAGKEKIQQYFSRINQTSDTPEN